MIPKLGGDPKESTRKSSRKRGKIAPDFLMDCDFRVAASAPKCTTASQPQSLAIFCIASEIARNFRSEKQIWPFCIAKCIATATVSLPQRNRIRFPRKNRCVQFDCVNESQTLTANHRRETVHLGLHIGGRKVIAKCVAGFAQVYVTLLPKRP